MFEGFTPETFDFLWGIRMNNNREWFLAHKSQYVNTLYEPMKALGKELFEPFLAEPGNLLKVSRIYRDARLHHPDPYKESLWICIRQDVAWWAENPCLYFEIRPEGVSYGLFIWKLRPAVMEKKRKRPRACPSPRKITSGPSPQRTPGWSGFSPGREPLNARSQRSPASTCSPRRWRCGSVPSWKS